MAQVKWKRGAQLNRLQLGPSPSKTSPAFDYIFLYKLGNIALNPILSISET